MITFLDMGLPAIGAVLAAMLVLRWGIPGFFGGVAVFWLSVLARVELLRALLPEREAPMHDILALVLGVPVGTVFCLLFLIGRAVYRRACIRRQVPFSLLT
jgi:hypothetical protein